jgi:hypothetical protein
VNKARQYLLPAVKTGEISLIEHFNQRRILKQSCIVKATINPTVLADPAKAWNFANQEPIRTSGSAGLDGLRLKANLISKGTAVLSFGTMNLRTMVKNAALVEAQLRREREIGGRLPAGRTPFIKVERFFSD